MQTKKAQASTGEMDEEEEQISIKEIDMLKEHNINVADIEKLKQAGLF
jgi:hypothetical protein